VNSAGDRENQLTIIPRDQHVISRNSISEAALKVLYRLSKSGFRACLVGGGVRDILLNIEPKDFDIATDATPEEIHQLFRNSRIIGRRFRLVHIRFGREIIEVATFRQHSEESPRTELNDQGRILRDNTFGDIEDDAIRRDFTANALYYDIANFSVLDYTQGLADIESRILRMIGDPVTRYQEDPVRMLRAIRFSAKLDFDIEDQTSDAILESSHLLATIPPARLFDETIKLFHSGKAGQVLSKLRHYNLLGHLIPGLNEWYQSEPDESMMDFIDQALVNTDLRMNSGQSLSPAFIFAVLLWPMVSQRANEITSDPKKMIPAIFEASDEIMARQVRTIAIPRRFSQVARNIWSSQPRFHRTQGKQPARMMSYPSFRAAYDFMCIQSMVGLMPERLCHWWTDYQEKNPPAPNQQPSNRYRKNPDAN
jgi:poly(A) polymerase